MLSLAKFILWYVEDDKEKMYTLFLPLNNGDQNPSNLDRGIWQEVYGCDDVFFHRKHHLFLECSGDSSFGGA